MQQSADRLQRLLIERHTLFCRSFAELFHDLVSSNDEFKEQRIIQNRDLAASLYESLSEADRPKWLKDVLAYLSNSRQSHPYSVLIDQLISVRDAVLSHQWVVAESTDQAIDFDEVFEKYKSESRLPNLFDTLVEVLSKIAESESMDSRAIVKVLQRLITSIQKSRNGSFYAMSTGLRFVIYVLEHFVMEELKRIPVLGSLVSALSEALKDLEDEITVVSERANESLKHSMSTFVPQGLYTRNGAPSIGFQNAQNAIDLES